MHALLSVVKRFVIVDVAGVCVRPFSTPAFGSPVQKVHPASVRKPARSLDAATAARVPPAVRAQNDGRTYADAAPSAELAPARRNHTAADQYQSPWDHCETSASDRVPAQFRVCIATELAETDPFPLPPPDSKTTAARRIPRALSHNAKTGGCSGIRNPPVLQSQNRGPHGDPLGWSRVRGKQAL